VAIPTPVSTPRPAGVPSCRAADLVGVFIGGQGAGGWLTRTFAIGTRTTTPCIVDGPIRATYLDAQDQLITAAVEESAGLAPSWAVLGPQSAPSAADDQLDGQAVIGLATYGDCGPAPELASVIFAFAPPTGEVRVPIVPARVGGRCDGPGEELELGIFVPLGPAPWSTQPPERSATPSPFALSIELPTVVFAGEPLSYVVHIRNRSSESYAWGDGCPTYLEWFGGRETPLPAVTERPGKSERPQTYVGVAKESHLLNCTAAGVIAPEGEIAFEMRIDVPPDALGPDTLRWEITAPFSGSEVSAPVEFLAPRR